MKQLQLKHFSILFFFIAKFSFAQNWVVLGKEVNTEYDELCPIISSDGSKLFYVIEGHPANSKVETVIDAQDIWMCEWNPQTKKWNNKIHLKDPLNQRKYNSIESISPDGNKIYIRGGYVNGVYERIGFSEVNRLGDTWSKPEELKIKNFSKMSKGSYTNMNMATNAQVMILAFSEVTSSPNNDLYVSFKVDDNEWSKPVYIKNLNTKDYAEGTPFLAADMRTIYFSSNRPGGMGDRDIWMSKRIGNSWKKWTEPINLGPTVNTEGWDGYYSVDASGEYTFMVVEDLRTGKTDIVQKQLKADLRPEKVVLVKGVVRDTLTMEPKAATIIYKDSLGITLGEAYSNPSDGSFTLVLPFGKKYFIRANVKDFYSGDQSIDLYNKSSNYENRNVDLWVKKINVGENINLKSVLFYQGTNRLKENSYLELQNVVDFLKLNPTIKIRLEGHTDNQGDPLKNIQLSEDRVKEVKAYLVKNGIDPKRIETIGYGSSKPLMPNTTEELRQKNRRVEFKIIEM